MPGNVCQYWSVDKNGKPIEPGMCSYWNVANTICTFPPDKNTGSYATSAPFCNLIGTDIACSKYKGTGVQACCVLPDLGRHVVNRRTGKKWVVPQSVNENGDVIGIVDFSAIDGYNGGFCDAKGTGHGDGETPNFLCAGYSPYHLQFGTLQPAPITATDVDLDGFTTVSGFDIRLPLGYEIYNKRAQLSRCYWWSGDGVDFTVVSTGADRGKIASIGTSLCSNPDPMVNDYKVFKFDNTTNMYRAPCNGCKPECPRYTGICWEYCTDVLLKHGDKVRAEQIMELRYYIKKDKWTQVTYNNSFAEPSLYAWAGTLSYSLTSKGNLTYVLPSVRTYMDSFETFEVKRSNLALTQGIPAEDGAKNYPSLVKELKSVTFAPIIRNSFETIEGTEAALSKNISIFETAKFDHKDILIVGDAFYYNDTTVFAINLSDPELNFLPKELLEYSSMSEIEAAKTDTFTKFYEKLDCTLEYIRECMPDKTPTSEIGIGLDSFCIYTPTFFGDNNIFVFAKGSGRWEFDKISVKKIFSGGVIGQLSFDVRGDGRETTYLPSYESTFNSNLNNNGEIGLQFFPMSSFDSGSKQVSCSVDYFYNDFVRKQFPINILLPPANDTYEIGYKLYKITAYSDLYVTMDDIKFLGNGGYALVTIPDEAKKIHHVFKPWTISGSLSLIYTLATDLETGQIHEESIEMEIYKSCDSGMDSNQFIMKPKDINKFKSVCDTVLLRIPSLILYEKRSFDDIPTDTYEVVRESFLADGDAVLYKLQERITSGDQGAYTLSGFGNNCLNIGAVFRGLTGKIKGQVKTKLITWSRQPFCRDVEIYYGWTAGFNQYKLLPEHNLYDARGIAPYGGMEYRSYVPACGDHNLSRIDGLGPMWYPYDDCETFARYNIIGNLSEWDINIMEVFGGTGDDGQLLHGKHDMRMLGPAENEGWTCDSHASLWLCISDWTFCNAEKKTPNMFAGYARYRGGMTEQDKLLCVENDGTLPKFGNVYRDFLRSFRSVDSVYYYYFDGAIYTRKLKWVAMPEYFSNADFTRSSYSMPYMDFSSSDYYDDGSLFLDQMGVLLASGDIEGVTIGEAVVVDTNNLPIRYEFDQVFKTHYSISGLYYPYPRNPNQIMINFNLVDIISWYTYKDAPIGGTSKSIQWAWREMWKDLERHVVTSEDIACPRQGMTYLGVHPCLSANSFIEEEATLPYRFQGNELKGRHSFLSIEYPEYYYDYEMKEHRLVNDEGDHTVTVTPHIYDDDGELLPDPYWSIKLNNGPSRCFDFAGEWLDNSEDCNDVLYSTCTVLPWVEDISLFDAGYTSVVPDPERTIQTYDGAGEPVYNYYQRGLNVAVDDDKFAYLPKLLKLIDFADTDDSTEVVFDTLPSCMTEDEIANNVWAGIDLGMPYPAENYFDLTYCSTDGAIELTYEFVNGDKSVGAIAIDYMFGADGITTRIGNRDVWLGDLYNIPGITAYKSSDGVVYTEILDLDTMFLSTKEIISVDTVRCFYEIPEIIPGEFSKFIKIELRLIPTTEEVDSRKGLSLYYNTESVSSRVWLRSVYLYKLEYTEAKETIKTYECKYNVSTGSHGDFPPHGYESTGSLLYVNPIDKSTVDQMDNIGGITGMPGSSGDEKTMNKCRGRVMKACHPDKESLDVGTGLGSVYNAEAEQSKIHNDIAINSGDTVFAMTSVVPPGLKEKLLEIGIAFPHWVCVFTNTLVLPLAPVKAQAPYSPAGHKFVWDVANVKFIYNCGRFGTPFARIPGDVTEAVFINAGTGDVTGGYIDAPTAYYRGMGSLIISPFVFQQRDATLRERYSAAYRAQSIAGTALQLQEAISPLY